MFIWNASRGCVCILCTNCTCCIEIHKWIHAWLIQTEFVGCRIKVMTKTRIQIENERIEPWTVGMTSRETTSLLAIENSLLFDSAMERPFFHCHSNSNNNNNNKHNESQTMKQSNLCTCAVMIWLPFTFTYAHSFLHTRTFGTLACHCSAQSKYRSIVLLSNGRMD